MPNNKNIKKMLGIGVLSLFLLGCSKDGFLLTEEGQDSVVVEDETLSSDSETVDNAIEATALQDDILLGVHVCGAVYHPGVYFLEQGQRICHAIEMAGGLRDEAEGDYVNQALLLEDGMKITIPTKDEVAQMEIAKTEEQKDNHKVDLNTADESILCTLPGIGESRAKSIISFRTKNGPFEKIEDIMKVSGIKEAAFEKIKDLIMVSK